LPAHGQLQGAAAQKSAAAGCWRCPPVDTAITKKRQLLKAAAIIAISIGQSVEGNMSHYLYVIYQYCIYG
jgi:hypothetical protein